MSNKLIENGDVYDIGQTVNGVSVFLYFNGQWFYFKRRLSRLYEYDQSDLTKCVLNESTTEDIKFIKNIFNP